MSKGTQYLRSIVKERFSGAGVPSLCSANEFVLKAALGFAKESGEFVLIESTANQVNQYGGYTGMTPPDFREYVFRLADETGLDSEKIILGGDHLGPVAFKDEREDEAMRKAHKLITTYVKAGFEKIHIDTSMRLGSDADDELLSDEVIAKRGAALCETAERAFEQVFGRKSDLVYVVGSEVPVPGGTQADDEELHVTSPEDFEKMYAAFEQAFADRGLEAAFERVIAVVVQPGVEFGDDAVDAYDSAKAKNLMDRLKAYESIVFEGHSTDYQTQQALSQMSADGICILKVGPELTFALREGLFALAYIDRALGGKADFIGTLDRTMIENPGSWVKYYTGTQEEKALKRKFSYSDRWRYYANEPMVQAAITQLFESLGSKDISRTLISQYLPSQYTKIMAGQLAADGEAIVIDKVKEILKKYSNATSIL